MIAPATVTPRARAVARNLAWLRAESPAVRCATSIQLAAGAWRVLAAAGITETRDRAAWAIAWRLARAALTLTRWLGANAGAALPVPPVALARLIVRERAVDDTSTARVRGRHPGPRGRLPR